ncbi:MAG TPA: MarR family transcriptional regulator [Acidimicrobiales bacterium]|nr:MarR family transcriptional regulator [Acidimicrobiales bacterium]
MEGNDNILWLLKQAAYSGRRAVDDVVAEHGVTGTQLGILNRLADEPGLSGAELARRSLITSQAAQLALASLERRGLVERKPDPAHGRIVKSYLTDQGREVVEACLEAGFRAQGEFVSVLSPAEQRKLAEMLRRLVRGPG